MSRRVAVLRPEPGNATTCARARAIGFDVVALPLFAIEALPWTPPDATDHDALLLTSANTLRMGGSGLRAFRSLPVFAVGAATGDAARTAGFDVMATGTRDAAALLDHAAGLGIARALHLGGAETTIRVGGPVGRSIAVYRSVPRVLAPDALAVLGGSVALLHSPRAAHQLGTLLDASGIARATIAIATLSDAVAAVAGAGWASVAIAATPTDAALLAAAQRLAN
ncbi:MAG: uroporphyrinogen-III synthase [Sphingomonas sp. 28-62-20]|uniref:uroporphyrinogen-III synthase n=1 Tax=Sphingomonas sp. 28-62-20 TaxID=1970433 RepID=UPI000BC4456B|nr:MAG: uroporphyrinogen-III synthase [Sphingomonas sp. 28-62-20]